MRRILVLTLLVLAPACTDRAGHRGRDAAISFDREDAAAPAPSDAGSDGGPPTDASALRDASETPDAPHADAGPPPACDAPVPDMRAELVPRCSAATRDCVAACADGACMRACVDADATPPWTMPPHSVTCGFCLAWQQKRCIDRSGCHAETAALGCCIEEHCPDGSCASTTCATQQAAWEACATSTAAACLVAPISGDYALCYPD